MKKCMVAVMGLLLVIMLTGCSVFGSATVKKSAAQKQCETFIEDIQYGEGLAEEMLNPAVEEGIIHEVLESMEYKVISSQENEDGSVLFKVEITSVDMLALLEALPEDVDSKESAEEAMLELADDTARKTYEVELTLVPVEGEEEYEVQPSAAFVNAVTGGMYDLLRGAMGLEAEQ